MDKTGKVPAFLELTFQWWERILLMGLAFCLSCSLNLGGNCCLNWVPSKCEASAPGWFCFPSSLSHSIKKVSAPSYKEKPKNKREQTEPQTHTQSGGDTGLVHRKALSGLWLKEQDLNRSQGCSSVSHKTCHPAGGILSRCAFV